MVDETISDVKEDESPSDTEDEGQLEVTVEPASGPSGEGGEGGTKLRERLETLEREKKDTYERLLRTAADLDNYRKRTRKELEEARVVAKEQILKEILPGIDNLERALAAAGGNGGAEGVVEGVRLVLRQFQTALERLDVKTFESVGQPFDPSRHEAISQIETDVHPPGVVAGEMQRGYTIGGRLLRPALVSVAKAAVGRAPGSDEEKSST